MADAKMDIVIGAEVQGAVNGMRQVEASLKKTGKEAEKFSQKGKTDFTNFSRVIQDLPFGLIGIQNNITQLLPAAGGLGLAISAITAAVTFAQIGFSNWTRGLNGSKQAVEEGSAALEMYAEEIENTKRKIEDFNTSLGNMQKAFSINNKIRFFGNDAQANLTETKNSLAFTIAEFNKLSQSVTEASDLSAKALKELSKFSDTDSEAFKKANEQYEKVVKNQFDLQDKLSEKLNEVQLARRQVAYAELQYNKTISDEAEKAAKKVEDAAKRAAKAAQAAYDAWKKEMTRLSTGGIVLGSFQQEIQKLVGPQGKLTISPTVQVKPFFDIKGLGQQAEALAAIVTDTIVNAFAAVGEGIGNLISGVANPFSALFNVIGNGMKALGKQMIEYAVLQKIMISALGSLNPFLSLAAGIALTALGTVISNMGAVKKFATGGVVTQPTLALVGEQGPERITPLGYEGNAGNMMQGAVQFVIRGQDLYGTLNRFTQNNRNIN